MKIHFSTKNGAVPPVYINWEILGGEELDAEVFISIERLLESLRYILTKGEG